MCGTIHPWRRNLCRPGQCSRKDHPLRRCSRVCPVLRLRPLEVPLEARARSKKQRVRSDLIIFDMVLHHISSPAKTFKECAELLNEQGSLLVVELRSHDQDWVRDTCGDLWLGFEERDLNHWAEKASLGKGQSSFLSLRNGFQIQIRVFQKT